MIASIAAIAYALWLCAWLASHRAGQRCESSATQPVAPLRSHSLGLLSGAEFVLKPVIYATVFWTSVLVRDTLPSLDASTATAIGSLRGRAGLAGPLLTGAISDRLFRGHSVRRVISAVLGSSIALRLFPRVARTQRWWLRTPALLTLRISLYTAESLIVDAAAAEADGS